MPAANLAAIFQPGLISHPDHDMNPQEYKVSQEVLIFLIEHQDRFLPVQAVRREASPARRAEVKNNQAQREETKAVAPPATYSGSQLKGSEVKLPRRRTMQRQSSPTGLTSKVLRRNRSTRAPQSPKLAPEQEEPRRVSEGASPSAAIDEEPTTTNLARRNTVATPRHLTRDISYEAGKQDGN